MSKPFLVQGPASADRDPAHMPVSDISSRHKAAIIIALLGADGARTIVEKLDDKAMASVARTLESIAYLSREQLVEIVVDFLQHLKRSEGALRAGPHRARDMVSEIIGANRSSTIFDPPGRAQSSPANKADRKSVWERLAERDASDLSDYLVALPANIAALILKRLDVATMSDVLAQFADDTLRAAVGELIDTQTDDPGVAAALERMIELEFLNNHSGSTDEDTGNLEALGEVFSLLPTDKRANVLEFLRAQHAGKLEKIEKSMFSIDTLADTLPRTAVPVVFREHGTAKMTQLISSLSGENASVSEFLLSNISSRLAEQIRDELTTIKAPDAAQTEKVQREFLTALMDLKRRNMIVLDEAD